MIHNSKIQEIFMSLPFSEAMRNCIKETNWKFSDFHIATLIFNNCAHYEERVEHLKEIEHLTDDPNLKKQIQQRLEGDKRVLAQLTTATPNCVFLLQDDKGRVSGVYGEYETALENFTWDEDFSIAKYQIISNKYKPQFSSGLIGIRDMAAEHQTVFEEDDNIPECLGEINFSSAKEMYSFRDIELDDDLIREIDSLDSSRFENAFVPLPNPFEEGDKVRIVSTGDCGVIFGSKASYEEIIERAKQDAFLDYTDTWLTIHFPNGDEGDHTHTSRFNLEFDNESN